MTTITLPKRRDYEHATEGTTHTVHGDPADVTRWVNHLLSRGYTETQRYTEHGRLYVILEERAYTDEDLERDLEYIAQIDARTEKAEIAWLRSFEARSNPY